MTNKKTSVGIIGAGITGLTTAYALQKRNIPVTVYEKNETVGGTIRTFKKDGWLIEEGPNTLMVRSQKIWDLLEKLNLTEDIIEANSEAKRRFVVKKNDLLSLPTSLGAFLKTPLLSAGAKLRLLKEPFVGSTDTDDESIATFIRRRLGKQPLDYGINPFISGVYAGDPEKLSIKHTFPSLWEMEQVHGSLLKGIIKKKKSPSPVKKALISFTEGNQMLPKALARALTHPVQTSCEIRSAQRTNACWKIEGVCQNHSFQADHDLLISTVPTHVLPSLFKSDLFDQLSTIPYVPISIMALGFKNEQIHHPLNGFGTLMPEVESHKALGILFSSTLFPDRAPDRHHLLSCFIGGARQPQLAKKSETELLELLLPELNDLLGIKGDPVFTHHTFWEQAIPQYEVGYKQYLSTMNRIEERYPGLLLGGNYRHGVSVPDCISSGFETAEKAAYILT